jgi:pullulanase/glycogen debranching enzyme
MSVTYEAVATEPILRHLRDLTAVELMPVHHHAYDRYLVERGRSNYWGLDELDDDGDPVRDDTFLLLLNAHRGPKAFRLPPLPPGRRWEVVLDTFHPERSARRRGDGLERLAARSLVLMREATVARQGRLSREAR